MKKNNILPTIDLQNSREYSGAYNSRDFYKGTSFKMAGEWITNTHYFNDEYIVDFVSFEGALLSCIRSHTSSSLNMPELVRENDKIIGIKPNPFWAFVMAGVEGPAGKVWVPEVKNGIISWKLDDETPTSIPSTNIIGPQGPEGKTPVLGLLKKGDLYYLTVNGEPLKDPETEENVPVQGPKGDTGDTGPKGADGKTPVFKIENGNWMLSYDNNKWENLGKAVGEDGVNGKDGKNGKDGITPYLRIENGRWMLSMDNQSSWKDIGQATGARGPEGRPGIDGRNGRDGKDGEDGISPILKITDNKWYVSYNDGATWQVLGRSIGDQGEPGKTPKLIRVFGDPATLLDDRILWGYDGVPVSEWTVLCYLNELKGDSIKSVNITDAEGSLELTMESSKVITATGSVLPRFNAGTIETVEWDQNPSLVIDKTNAPREWALNVKVPKGKPATVTVVSEVEKLAPDAQPYVTDLNPDISDANLKFGIPQGEKGDPGDENIAIGCQSDFPNNEPEHDKIWYNPCDEAMDQYSVQDFLYHSYIAVGGTLNQEQFEAAWKSFPNTAEIVEIIDSLESDKTDAALSAAQGKALKTLIDDLKASVAAALDYKGTKDSYDQLPSSGNKKGDVWNVVAAHGTTPAGTNYAWDGAKWDPLGGTIDLSAYATKTAVTSEINTKIGTLDKADTAVTGQVVSAVSETDGIITVSRRALVVADIPTLATSKISGLDTALNGKVPTTRTVNSKPLSANVVLAGADILVGGDGTYGEDDLQTAIKAMDSRITSVAASGVQSFGGQTGAITVDTANTTNGQVKFSMSSKQLKGTVNGLKSAAYTESSAYATSAQGTKADSALQQANIATGSANGTISVKGTDVPVKGLNSAAYVATSAFDTAGAATTALNSAKAYANGLMTWAEFE